MKKKLADIGLTPKQMNSFIKAGIHPYDTLEGIIEAFSWRELVQLPGISKGSVDLIVDNLPESTEISLNWASHVYARKRTKS